MCDLAILFVRHRPQHCHGLLNHWPWSGRVCAIQEVRHHTLFPVNSPKSSHICNGSGQFFKTNLNIWCTFEKSAQLITKKCVVLRSVTPIRIQWTNRIIFYQLSASTDAFTKRSLYLSYALDRHALTTVIPTCCTLCNECQCVHRTVISYVLGIQTRMSNNKMT